MKTKMLEYIRAHVSTVENGTTFVAKYPLATVATFKSFIGCATVASVWHVLVGFRSDYGRLRVSYPWRRLEPQKKAIFTVGTDL